MHGGRWAVWNIYKDILICIFDKFQELSITLERCILGPQKMFVVRR